MIKEASRVSVLVFFFVILLLGGGYSLRGVAQVPVGDVIQGQQGAVVGHVYQAPLLATPPQISANQMAKLRDALSKPPLPGPAIPFDPTGSTGPAPPTSPNLPVKSQPLQAQFPSPQAPGDFVFFRNSILGTGTGGLTAEVGEPNVGSNGSAIFQTGNWYASVSVDNGGLWSFVNPFTLFPTTGDFSGGFCCDQRVAHAAAADLVLWYLQYIKTGTTSNDINGVRIAAAVGTTGLASNTWCTLDFTSESFGLGRGKWLDFPHMQVSNNFVYATSNVFTTTTSTFTEAVMWSVPLSNFQNNCQGGGFTFWVVNNGFSLALTNNATATMYAGSIESSTSVRVYAQNESDSALSSTVVSGLNQTFFGLHSCPGPDGNNWCGRADSRIEAAWVAGGVIGFMWNSAQGTGRPQPFVRALQVVESTKVLIDQPEIWDNTFAWHYPAIGVNGRGDIAGPVWSGSSTVAPLVSIVIADSFATVPPPWDSFVAATGTNGGNNQWGDYLGAQPHDVFLNTWIGVGYVLNGPSLPPGTSNSNIEAHFFWFGREQDNPGLPPPSCSTVDEDFETGDFSKFPWTTGGNANWAIATDMVNGGTFSAKAPVAIGDNQSSFLEVTLTVELGSICFFRKVSSEQSFDFLKFFIDGVEKGSWSGELPFAREAFPVTAGIHTFRWEYIKDFMVSSGQDTTWIDDISFPLPPPGTAAVFRVEKGGNVFADGSFNAGGADLAERIDVSEPVEPGDVVELDPSNPKQYRKARGSYSPLVAGVISTTPGFALANRSDELAPGAKQTPVDHGVLRFEGGLLNKFLLKPIGENMIPFSLGLTLQSLSSSEAPMSGKLARLEARWEKLVQPQPARGRPLLALMGQVYVKATAENGPIAPGDLLTVASRPGYAMRCADINVCKASIVGKALQAVESGEGLILILVMSR